MSMEITNNYSHYAADYTKPAKKSASSNNSEEKGVTTSTVELKTPKPGITRTEQIKTGFSTAAAYSRYLQGRYSYMNTGTTSMEGIPMTVSVSGAFLKKCMNDPQKAAYLEENLAAIPDCVNSLANFTKRMPGSPVCTYATYIIGDDGNITCMSGCTNDPDGKIARENALKKEKEQKAAEEKAAKKRAEKKEAEEKRAEKLAEKKAAEKSEEKTEEYTANATGTDIKTVTQSVIKTVLGTGTDLTAGFDARA